MTLSKNVKPRARRSPPLTAARRFSMLRSRRILLLSVILFFSAETALGILFQTGYGNGAHLRYATVVLACLFCFLFVEKSWEYLTLQLALIATVWADYYLVLPSSPNQLPGMIFFAAAQISYALSLCFTEDDPRRLVQWLWARGILSAVAVAATLAVLGSKADAVAVISVFYYANLVLNIAMAWSQLPRRAVMAVGLTLFLCCDTVIGLAFLDGYLPVSETSLIYRLIHPGFDLAWAFYLPSQMLLAISLLPARWKAATQKHA